MLGVSHKYTLEGLGRQFIVRLLLNINVMSPNLRQDTMGLFPFHISYGVFSTVLDEKWLSVKSAASRALPFLRKVEDQFDSS